MSVTWESDLWEGLDGVEVECGVRLKQGKEKHTSVIDLTTSRIDRFQQLVDFVVTHLLAEIGQNYNLPRQPSTFFESAPRQKQINTRQEGKG